MGQPIESDQQKPQAELLRELAALPFHELESRFRAAGRPGSLREIDGDLECRILSVRHDAYMGRLLMALYRADLFAWVSKTFTSQTDTAGSGINDLRMPIVGRQKRLPFVSTIGPSAIDGEPCIILDYDSPQNPAFFRSVFDELRPLGAGVFIGLGVRKRKSGRVGEIFFVVAKR